MTTNIAELFEQQLSVSVNPTVAKKSEELCAKYNIVDSEFVDQWIAFTISNQVEIEPHLDTIELFERKCLASTVQIIPKTPKSARFKSYQSSPKNIVNSPIDNFSPVNTQKQKSNLSHGGPDQQSLQSPKSVPPPNDANKMLVSSKFSERSGIGKVLTQFGNNELLEKATWNGKNLDLSITQLNKVKDIKYMYANVREETPNWQAAAMEIAMEICKANNFNKLDHFTDIITEKGIVYGSLSISNGKTQQVALTSIDKRDYGTKVKMDLKLIPEYFLYSGQVVVAEATNHTKYTLLPTKIFTDAKLPINNDMHVVTGSSLQILTACGPYTCGNLYYEPLTALLQYVTTHKPDILLLHGPFISEDTLIDTGDETVTQLFDRLVDTIMIAVKEIHTHVILIPSMKDENCPPIYPTPSYKLSQQYPRLYLMTDPSIISINGLRIATTSVDVLKMLSKIHICKVEKNPDPISRLIQHLFEQKRIFPMILETSPMDDLPFDVKLWMKLTKLDVMPHILLLPSVLTPFIKVIKGCVCINPRNLGEISGGSFARIQVLTNNTTQPIENNIIGQIIQI